MFYIHFFCHLHPQQTTTANSSFIKNVGRHKNRFFCSPKNKFSFFWLFCCIFDSFCALLMKARNIKWKETFAVFLHPLWLLVLNLNVVSEWNSYKKEEVGDQAVNSDDADYFTTHWFYVQFIYWNFHHAVFIFDNIKLKCSWKFLPMALSPFYVDRDETFSHSFMTFLPADTVSWQWCDLFS